MHNIRSDEEVIFEAVSSLHKHKQAQAQRQTVQMQDYLQRSARHRVESLLLSISMISSSVILKVDPPVSE